MMIVVLFCIFYAIGLGLAVLAFWVKPSLPSIPFQEAPPARVPGPREDLILPPPPKPLRAPLPDSYPTMRRIPLSAEPLTLRDCPAAHAGRGELAPTCDSTKATIPCPK